jgi:4-hydroxy-3-polyprenylbenzoate decarboxylase
MVIAMSGASGAIYGVRLLQALKDRKVETHLILSGWAEKVLEIETSFTVDQVKKMATYTYDVNDLSAPIASGSFPTSGMVIVPCSTKTLAAVANGYTENLIHRSAEVMLKEKRPLIVCPRETPLNQIHIENMSKLAKAGAVIFPLAPPFYHKQKTVDDLVNQIVGKILDLFRIESKLLKRWGMYKTR